MHYKIPKRTLCRGHLRLDTCMQNTYSLFNLYYYYCCTVHAEIVSSSNLFLFQSHNVKVCDIDDDVKDALKKFRFRKNDKNAALISKWLRCIVMTSLKYCNNLSVKCNFLNFNLQLLECSVMDPSQRFLFTGYQLLEVQLLALINMIMNIWIL
jgi:hypothetical protein